MNESEFDYEPDDDVETEYIVDPVTENDDSLIYGMYSQLKTHKDHFSNMQNRYRTMSSSWVIAGFIGIGFLLSRHDLDLPFDSLLVIAILSICIAIGISLLWHLDIVLYQKLWLGSVVEMARLEKNHKWLPKVNLSVLFIREKTKYNFFQSIYYIGVNTILILFSGISIGFYLSDNTLAMISTIILTLLAIVLAGYQMIIKSGELDKITIDSFR